MNPLDICWHQLTEGLNEGFEMMSIEAGGRGNSMGRLVRSFGW